MATRSKGAARASAILVVGAAVCFGTTGTAQALGGSGASALSLGAARIVFGGTLLALIALIALTSSRSRTPTAPTSAPGWRLRSYPEATRRRWLKPAALVAIGAVGV